ncbi:MAG TPA: VOC family protein [Chloroflexota bacterium]|nr:VOC family protein [Chloroflexota bacterium]
MPDQKAQILHFDHAGVTVADLDRSVAFYHDVLGMVEVERTTLANGTSLVFLRMGEAGLIELIHRPGGSAGRHSASSPAVAHVCFQVNDLDAWIARLARHEVALTSGPSLLQFPSGKVRLIFIADPDGIPVELYERENDV